MIYNMKTISITVDEAVLARLDRLANSDLQEGANRSSMIRDAMRTYVAGLERRIDEDREREVFGKRRAQLEKEAVALVREQASS